MTHSPDILDSQPTEIPRIKLDLLLNSTLKTIYNNLDPGFITNTIKNYTILYQDNPDIWSNIFCLDHGFFSKQEYKCTCEFGYFGRFCSSTGKVWWSKGWPVFRVLFCICYGILLWVNWYYFCTKMKAEESCLQRINRVLLTPKYWIMINIWIISHARFIFLWIDPFNMNEYFGYRSNIILYELIYSSIISFYFSWLIIWIGMNNAFKMDLNPLNKYLNKKRILSGLSICKCDYIYIKIICLVLMILCYPFQILFSYFSSFRTIRKTDLNLMIYVLVFVCFLVIVFTVIYTNRLRHVWNKNYHQQWKLHNFQTKTIKINDYTSFDMSKDAGNNDKKTSQEHSSWSDTTNWGDIDTYTLDFEKEMTYLNESDDWDASITQHKMRTSDCNNSHREHTMNSNLLTLNNKSPIKEDREQGATKDGIMELTELDIKNLNKIFGWTYFIIGTTIFVVCIVFVLSNGTLSDSSFTAIIVLSAEFVCEIWALFAIFRLFVQDIKNQEYNNLQMIARIEKYTNNEVYEMEDGNDEIKLLKYDGVTDTKIWNRFRAFIKTYKEEEEKKSTRGVEDQKDG